MPRRPRSARCRPLPASALTFALALALGTLAPVVSAAPALAPAPGPSALVDLGYTRYQGVYDELTGLNSWLGIRYAAPATPATRWSPPEAPPLVNRTVSAKIPPPACLQQSGAAQAPANNAESAEDCLYVNVVSPANATGLPVLVWFHGGGYGAGSAGAYDPAALIRASDTKFVFVAVQYRLGILGFLSSADLVRNGGVANAGLLDQNASLNWVQNHISAFGGDPARVTIAGQSAGGGSVLHHSVSYNGSLGSTLFKGLIASSPSPGSTKTEWYNSSATEQLYTHVAQAAQCPPGSPFACLTNLTFAELADVSQIVTSQGPNGTWAFNPVIDGTYLVDEPSKLLALGQVNGQYAMVGHNAEEGTAFVPNVMYDADSAAWLAQAMPFLAAGQSAANVTDVLAQYPYDAAVDTNFATSGAGAPTVTTTQSTTFGEHARLANIWAEANIICPSEWLGSAYGPRGFLYQYSVVPALHTSDLSLIFPSIAHQSYHGPGLTTAFQTFWTDFIVRGDPRAQACEATTVQPAADAAVTSPSANSNHALCNWPTALANISGNAQANETQRLNFLNLNQTGGHQAERQFHAPLWTNYYADPGLENDFAVANSYTWEGGRGARCDWWRNLLASP